MRFSALFGFRKTPSQPEIATDSPVQPNPGACDSLPSPGPLPQPISTHLSPSQPISTEIEFSKTTWFLPKQVLWLEDAWHLRIWEKSRQVGATKTDSFDSVMKVSPADAKFDVWVTSRDELQARLYLEDCKEWAKILHLAVVDLGLVLLGDKKNSSGFALQFANGRRIYCLSSNPNALAGKRGHVKIDEFALHPDQRLLYKIAKPVTQWGGSLSIISTHRGPNTVFNQIIRDILHNGNPMGWHHYRYTIQDAVAEGLVERINEKSGRHETNEQFLRRTKAECLDNDSWLQEYCCIPADETTAFLSHDLIASCEDPDLKLLTIDQLKAWLATPDAPENPELYLGMDVARSELCVLDLGIRIDGIMHDLLRLELRGQTFPTQRAALWQLLALPQLKRACIDHNGNGMEMSEDAQQEFGSKVEPVHTSAPVQHKLAFGLRNAFESRTLRIAADPRLRADLHGIGKQTTAAGNIQLGGKTDDSHCDRFWAKALRQEAARHREETPWAYP